MTGCERNEVSCSLTTHSLSLRVGRQSDAAIHRVLYASWSTVDRHGLRPRDDKMRSDAVCGSITTRSCHCELEDSPMRQSIVSCTLPGAQWIATGYALAMTRCEVMQCAVRLQHTLVIARKERSEGRGTGWDNPLSGLK